MQHTNTAPEHIRYPPSPAGREWDAIRVPRYVGLKALHQFTDDPGAVLVDPGPRTIYLFVPPGAASSLHDLEGVQVIGSPQCLWLPPPGRRGPPGPYWLSGPTELRVPAASARLTSALKAAMRPSRGWPSNHQQLDQRESLSEPAAVHDV